MYVPIRACIACYQQVTRRMFEASGGRLKVVGKGGVGIENIDLAAATEVRRLG